MAAQRVLSLHYSQLVSMLFPFQQAYPILYYVNSLRVGVSRV